MSMYTHTTREERIALGALLREGYSQKDAAEALGRDASSISRELGRNSKEDGRYHATHADVLARERREGSKQGSRKIENDPELAEKIEEQLHPLVSPEVVAHEVGIVHETIYAWISRTRPDLKQKLPQRRRYGSKRAVKQGWTRDVRSIHDMAEDKNVWEGDTIKRRTRSRVGTYVHKRSLFTIADLMPDGTSDSIYSAVFNRTEFDDSSLLLDRGSEFAQWKLIEKKRRVSIFFADPHHPWQRGKNENTNGRLRRVFPKKFDFSTIKQQDLDNVLSKMNHTKRKSLSWATPCEVFSRCCTSNWNSSLSICLCISYMPHFRLQIYTRFFLNDSFDFLSKRFYIFR